MVVMVTVALIYETYVTSQWRSCRFVLVYESY